MATFNWPGFGLASISPTLDQPSQSNSSAWTGKRTVVADPWHGKWSFKVTLATQQGDAAFQAARGFFTGLKGQVNTFHLPAVEAPQNGNTGVTLSAGAAQGATSLALTGVTTALVAGNMVTIAGQLLSLTSVGSLSVSAQTVNFEPALRAAALSGASVETAKPYALVFMSDSSFSWDIGKWRLYGLTFNATEAVSETDGADPALDIWTGGVGSGGSGTSFTFPQLTSFISRSVLAAVASPTDKQVAYLTEAGREGDFVFSTANLSTNVTADTAQGIYVAPVADTTGASGAWVRKFSGSLDAKWFGAKCDAAANGSTGTDDTTAINAAVTFAAFRGGAAILIPAHTTCSGPVTANSLRNIRFVGPSGPGAGYGIFPPAQLIYTGTGVRFIDLRSSLSCEIVNLGIRYTSGSFTGDVVDFSHDGSAADSTYGRVSGCLIGGIGVYSARRCINLLDAIRATIKENHISCAAVGIGGKLESSPGYSNAHSIKDNTFDNLTTSAIINAGEAWTIISNGFEGTNDGVSGGMPRAFYDDFTALAGNIINGLTWIGNWCGDDVAVADAWFSNNNSEIRGLCIKGGTFFNTGVGKSIKLPSTVSGGSISGLTCKEIDLGSVAHYGLDIKGNFYTNEISNLSAGALDVEIKANKVNGGFAKTYTRIANPQEMALGDPFGATGVFATVTGVHELDAHGLKVIGARGAAVTDAVNAAAAPTQAEFNAFVTQFNAWLARARAHGMIS